MQAGFIAESSNFHPSKVKLYIQLHPVDFLSSPLQWSPPFSVQVYTLSEFL